MKGDIKQVEVTVTDNGAAEITSGTLADNNIHIIGMGGGKLRMVTHLDYSNEMHEALITILHNLN